MGFLLARTLRRRAPRAQAILAGEGDRPMPDLAGTITIGDLTVGRLGFGAMRVTGPGIWGAPPDEAAALALLRHVVASGVTFLDTADSYGPGVSEELLAKALHPYPKDILIATKGGLERPGPNQWVANCRPAHLRQACEDSLKRLRVARIDLYQLHTVDTRVPIEDSVGTLAELQRQGKIRHIGVSNISAEQLARARKVAPIVSVQNRYSLADRGADALVELCAREGLAFIPWYPLAAGQLSGGPSRLAEAARRLAATPAQVAIAWLLRRSPAMLPIPGTSSLAHFDENRGAASLVLPDEDFAALSRS
jgi:pyridoxine 4-dehydrogenase